MKHRLVSVNPVSRMVAYINASLKQSSTDVEPLGRLVRFLRKYPPSQYSSQATGQAIPTSKQRRGMDAKPLSSTTVPQARSIPVPLVEKLSIDQDSISEPSTLTSEPSSIGQQSRTSFPPNPFLPYRNPETGRWRGARLGLRQQADLYKLAREYGVEELLPSSIKSSAYKQARVLERGLAVKGTGEGQSVKGHKWERTRPIMLEKRVKAMEGMPELVREWERRGHGRGWKKWPSQKNT